MEFVDLGFLDFAAGYEKQKDAIAEIWRDALPERVHFVEHPHVFTLGRSGDPSNLLTASDPSGREIELVRIGRGGDITYHGPGQLVGYPHLDLRKRGRDVHRYLRDLEEVLIRTADAFGVRGFRRSGLTGVWTESGKLASIGVGVRRWITLHGFALNVNPDLRYFDLINPCGIQDCRVTSLSEALDHEVEIEAVKEVVTQEMKGVFGSLSGRSEDAQMPIG